MSKSKVTAAKVAVDGRSSTARKLRSIGSALAAALLRADHAERIVIRQQHIILEAKALMAAKAELARDKTGQLENVELVVAGMEDRLELAILSVTEETDKVGLTKR